MNKYYLDIVQLDCKLNPKYFKSNLKSHILSYYLEAFKIKKSNDHSKKL